MLFILPLLLLSLSAIDGPKEPGLRAELFTRVRKDQELRKRLLELQVRGPSPALSEARKAVQKVDQENTAWLAEIVEDRGWPGRSLVGLDGSRAAWLLVQHADHDPAFQKSCLKLMKKAAPGEVVPADLALLEDRVRVADGRAQLYATQLAFKDGDWRAIGGVEAPENLDARRRAAGLPPFAQYKAMLEQVYGRPAEPKKKARPEPKLY